MYGLNSVTTLGLRLGKELDQHLTQAQKTLSKDVQRNFTKSQIARQIMEDFFHNPQSLKKSFRDYYRRKR
jgi:hypothetical protein